jgi:hypothetical protein
MSHAHPRLGFVVVEPSTPPHVFGSGVSHLSGGDERGDPDIQALSHPRERQGLANLRPGRQRVAAGDLADRWLAVPGVLRSTHEVLRSGVPRHARPLLAGLSSSCGHCSVRQAPHPAAYWLSRGPGRRPASGVVRRPGGVVAAEGGLRMFTTCPGCSWSHSVMRRSRTSRGGLVEPGLVGGDGHVQPARLWRGTRTPVGSRRRPALSSSPQSRM